MAIPVATRAALQALKPGEHSRGLGRCPACGSHRLPTCGRCGEHTLHRVCTWSDFSEQVCENAPCNALENRGVVVRFSAEMKEALYQLELKERRERKH
jgi:predicted amidophosphoribosyltransferase